MKNNDTAKPQNITPARLEATEDFASSGIGDGIGTQLSAWRASKISGFSVTRTLGAGNMGVVLLVEKDGRQYAMKLIRTVETMARDPETRLERFMRKAELLSTIRHPNVVEILEYGVSGSAEEGVPFLVMEFVQGHPLNQYPGAMEKTLDWKFSILRQIASALATVHSHRIVHRDVKPGNILVSDEGLAKLDDFGTAGIMDSDPDSMLGVFGSPAYMAPEAFDRGRAQDKRSDIFSLGVVAYELITGVKPFHGSNIEEMEHSVKMNAPIDPTLLESSLHPGVRNALAKMLAKSPSDRFQSMEEVERALSSPYPEPPLPVGKKIWRGRENPTGGKR